MSRIEQVEMQTHLKRLYALAEVDLLTLENLDEFDSTLSRIVKTASDVVQSNKGASIILWDADKETFSLSATTVSDLSPEDFSSDTRLTGGVTRWIIDHLQYYVVENVKDDPFRKGRKMKDYGVGSYLGVPLHYNHKPLGVLFIFNEEPRKYSDNEMLFCKLLANRASTAIMNAKHLSQLFHKATRDELTGLLNRATFFEVAERLFEEHKRNGQEMSIMFMDVDNFKHINDTYGHLIGDRILRLVGQSISKITRSMDVAARYGGDEFILLFSNTSLKQLEMIKARFYKYLGNVELGISADELKISIGQTSTRYVNEFKDLIRKADSNMYHKKRTGSLAIKQNSFKR